MLPLDLRVQAVRHLQQTNVRVRDAVRPALRHKVAFAERRAPVFGIDRSGIDSRAGSCQLQQRHGRQDRQLVHGDAVVDCLLLLLLFGAKPKVRRRRRNGVEPQGSQVLGLIIRDRVNDGTDTNKATLASVRIDWGASW